MHARGAQASIIDEGTCKCMQYASDSSSVALGDASALAITPRAISAVYMARIVFQLKYPVLSVRASWNYLDMFVVAPNLVFARARRYCRRRSPPGSNSLVSSVLNFDLNQINTVQGALHWLE